MKKLRIGILFGGQSVEHEVSLLSAKNVVEALDKTKYDPVPIGIDQTGAWHLAKTVSPTQLNSKSNILALIPGGISTGLIELTTNKPIGLDIVLPVLHGANGEDGSMQGLLRLLDLPFVGPGVLSSALCLDKDMTKRLLRDAGLPVAKFITLRKQDDISFDKITAELGLPFFVKPANTGSSIGVCKVKKKSEFYKSVAEAFYYDRKIIIEEYIKGREIECSVLGNEKPTASLPGEVETAREFYTYEAKYLDVEGTKLIVPAKLDEATIKRIQDLAIKTFKTLVCEGMARVDFFLKYDGSILINEVNTIPGFTNSSMYPKLWMASGVEYSQLLDRLIAFALERHENESRLKKAL